MRPPKNALAGRVGRFPKTLTIAGLFVHENFLSALTVTACAAMPRLRTGPRTSGSLWRSPKAGAEDHGESPETGSLLRDDCILARRDRRQGPDPRVGTARNYWAISLTTMATQAMADATNRRWSSGLGRGSGRMTIASSGI